MLIAKHFDPVMGIDIHILVIPPAGPVPIPHPHIAMVLDLIDYVPILGATVLVGGIPRATAGSAGRPIPHIPMGGPFLKPPMNENEVFMGSMTVVADGSPLTFTALPALSCHDIGVIAPIRRKKPKKSFGMVLPTSVVLSIPVGMPVMVGGPPTIDMMGLAMMAGFAALGAAFKKLRKLQKKSKRFKKISKAVHKRAKKAMDKLGVPPNVRNKVHKGICTVTGHPVDVASGKMFTDHIDFELPGPLPLVWERTWYSSSVYDGPLGHGWHHSYDMALSEENNSVAVRLADGRAIGFPALKPGEESFDRTERLTLICDSQGYAVDNHEGIRFRFAPYNGRKDYQPIWSVVEKSSGAQITFFYDINCYLIGIVDSAGRKIRIQNFDDGKIQKIFLPHPDKNKCGEYFCAVEYNYSHNNLINVANALQQKFSYSYNGYLMTKETNRNGLSFYFEYDGIDHDAFCTHTWGDGDIYNHRLHYDRNNNITIVTNSLGYSTTYQHNGSVVHKVIDANHATRTTERNNYNQIIREVDPNGNETLHQYDDSGYPTRIILANGGEKKFAYDAHHNLVEYSNEVDATWKFEYNIKNRLIKEIDPVGATIFFEYRDNQLYSITDALFSKKFLSYDAEHNVCAITEEFGDITTFTHNALGSIIEIIDTHKNSKKFAFNLLGQITHAKEIDGTIHRMQYDNEGNIIYLTVGELEIFYQYQGFNRIASKKQNNEVVRYKYNTEEKLVEITNNKGADFKYLYDACSNIIMEKAFDGLIKKYTRDNSGKVIRIDRGNDRHSIYTHNRIGKIIKIEHSDNLTEEYFYRKDGEMISAKNSNSSVHFELDPLGRVTKETQGEIIISSKYDLAGNRINFNTSLGCSQSIKRNVKGQVLDIECDNANYKISYTRDALGNELQKLMPGGIHSRWKRDQLGRPIENNLNVNNILSKSREYSWNKNFEIQKIVANGSATTYLYNDYGNPTSSIGQYGNFDSRNIDSIGNVYKSPAENDRQYYDGGRIKNIDTRIEASNYEYDSDGNLITRTDKNNDVWRYIWNHAGLLIRVIRPDSKTVDFLYDALGRRTAKLYNGKITKWIWDGDVPLHEWTETLTASNIEAQNRKSLNVDAVTVNDINILFSTHVSQAPPISLTTWYFEPESFSPLGKQVDDQFYSIVTDHLGIPTSMYDHSGKEIWSGDLDLWGNLKITVGDAYDCPFRWPGQYEDVETGLYYNRFRYYSPETGQYISQDPIGLAGEKVNLYGYVNNVLNQSDPLGLVDGGSYREVRDSNVGGQVNHMPANSVSPLSHGKGPGTWMTTADHQKTASWGSWGYAKRWREQQKELIQRGKFGKAMEMDIRDVQRHFGNKYNNGIKEMIDYAAGENHITQKEANRLKRRYCH